MPACAKVHVYGRRRSWSSPNWAFGNRRLENTAGASPAWQLSQTGRGASPKPIFTPSRQRFNLTRPQGHALALVPILALIRHPALSAQSSHMAVETTSSITSTRGCALGGTITTDQAL